MPNYAVDVKAFMTVRVEAPNEQAARAAAEEFVEACDPTDPFIWGYNQHRINRPIEPHKVTSANGFSVDGTSPVEQVCSECEDELNDDEKQAGICRVCEPEPEEPPLDTPSLDTSFHDNEMEIN